MCNVYHSLLFHSAGRAIDTDPAARSQQTLGIISKAPQGNGIGATGSENPRAYQNPCFSLLGMVLRTWDWF